MSTVNRHIMGKSDLPYDKFMNWVNFTNDPVLIGMGDIWTKYYVRCENSGVRPEVAIAQVIYAYRHAEGNGEYLIRVANNPAHLKDLENETVDHVFKNIKDGISAHVQRLKAYAVDDDNPKGIIFDPRYDFIHHGVAKDDILRLSGKSSWASPGYDKKKYRNIESAEKNQDTYGYEILKLIQDFSADIDAGEEIFDTSEEKKEEVAETPVTNNSNDEVYVSSLPFEVCIDEVNEADSSEAVGESAETVTNPYAEIAESIKSTADEVVDKYFDQIMKDLRSAIRKKDFSRRLRLSFYTTDDEDDALTVLYKLRTIFSGKLNGLIFDLSRIYIIPKTNDGNTKYEIQYVPLIVDCNSEKLKDIKTKLQTYVKSEENTTDDFGLTEEESKNILMRFY